jgi:hypothetical protein
VRGGDHTDGARWLGLYRSLLPIRTLGAFHLTAARLEDGQARVVVTGAPRRDPIAVGAALAEAARVQALVEHPLFPRVGRLGMHEGQPFLELVSDAVADGHAIVRWTAESGARFSYSQGDAIFTQAREAMQAAHRVTDPRTGQPICLGSLCLGNILLTRDGRLSLVGLGHNFALALENGALDGTCTVFSAREVAMGFPPTPGSDYVAVLLAARSLVNFADVAAIAEMVTRRGLKQVMNLEVLRTMRYFETEWISQLPSERPPIEDGLAKSMRLREMLGTSVDREGLARMITDLIADNLPPIDLESIPSESDRATLVARDGSWIETPSGRKKLGRAHGLILLALLEARDRSQVLDVWTLLERGWPGEECVPEAGQNRVYVALTRLRSLGLRDAIEHHDGGYRLRPSARLERS